MVAENHWHFQTLIRAQLLIQFYNCPHRKVDLIVDNDKQIYPPLLDITSASIRQRNAIWSIQIHTQHDRKSEQ